MSSDCHKKVYSALRADIFTKQFKVQFYPRKFKVQSCTKNVQPSILFKVQFDQTMHSAEFLLFKGGNEKRRYDRVSSKNEGTHCRVTNR